MTTSAINLTNSAWPYSRFAYIDPLLPRSTFHVLADAPVLRIYWGMSSSEITAKSGVWQADTTDSEHTITVNKEVILSGGVVVSPHIMFLSGIGPFSVLQAASTDVVLDLPDVGQNVKDSIGNGINWAAQGTTTMSIETSKSDLSKTATSAIRSDYATSESCISSTDSTILAGCKSTFNVITQTYYPSAVPQVEILLSLNAANTVTIQAALQHRLSHGQITVSSTSAFDTPIIDPGYFSHWAHRDIIRTAFRLIRNIAAAQSRICPLCAQTIGE
ncbi:hypothetical protein IW262DRAFT_1469093 [Armillaria fumosa]|nr:hypothetical protein IW262DRAFT_1469093 [Armillaria fumosa]